MYDQGLLKSPEAFPGDMEFGAVLGIAREAYERKTGSEWEYISSTDYETFSNEHGWA